MIRKNKPNGHSKTPDNPTEKKEYWWEARASIVKTQNRDEIAKPTRGRPPKFESPEQLWEACCEYFKWVEENPLYASQVITYKGRGSLVKVPKQRAMTISGLSLFLGMKEDTWRDYRDNKDQNFSSVCKAAEQVIRDQKFSGAAADLFNAHVISRDLGLKEQSEVSGPGGGPIQTQTKMDPSKLSTKELQNLVAAMDKASTGKKE